MNFIKTTCFAILSGMIASILFISSVNAQTLNVNDPCGSCSNNAWDCTNDAGCISGGICDKPSGLADRCVSGFKCVDRQTGGLKDLRCTSSSAVWGDKNADQLAAGAGLGTSDPRDIIASVVNVLLGFLGTIAVLLILYGGFMWMTSAGNDDRVATAKNLMIAGVVGLVIVLAAFGVSKFVVEALLGATGATT